MMPWLQQIVTGAWRPGYRSMHASAAYGVTPVLGVHSGDRTRQFINF